MKIENVSEYVEKQIESSTKRCLTSAFGVIIEGSAVDVFDIVKNIGGKNGWYTFDFMITLRSLFGPKRKNPAEEKRELKIGGNIDLFEIIDFTENESLYLKFEMKGLEGEANFHIEPTGQGRVRLISSCRLCFLSSFGRVYWFFVKPFDYVLRRRMLLNIGKIVEKKEFSKRSAALSN